MVDSSRRITFICMSRLYISGDANYIYRGMSIFATLFVILITPELWGI